MPKWSRQQDEFLLEHCNEGPERCADLIRHRFGVSRTPEAVRRHAYRVGIPIIEYSVCSGCGAKTRKPDDDGMCPTCHQRRLAERYRQRNRAMLREIHDDSGLDEARREYDRERKREERLRKRCAALGVFSVECHA